MHTKHPAEIMASIKFSETRQYTLIHELEDALEQKGWRVIEKKTFDYIDPLDAWEIGYWSIQRSNKVNPLQLVFMAEMGHWGDPQPQTIGQCQVKGFAVKIDFYKMGQKRKKPYWFKKLRVFLDALDEIERSQFT